MRHWLHKSVFSVLAWEFEFYTSSLSTHSGRIGLLMHTHTDPLFSKQKKIQSFPMEIYPYLFPISTWLHLVLWDWWLHSCINTWPDLPPTRVEKSFKRHRVRIICVEIHIDQKWTSNCVLASYGGTFDNYAELCPLHVQGSACRFALIMILGKSASYTCLSVSLKW